MGGGDFCRPLAAYFDLQFINFLNFKRDHKEVHKYIIDAVDVSVL